MCVTSLGTEFCSRLEFVSRSFLLGLNFDKTISRERIICYRSDKKEFIFLAEDYFIDPAKNPALSPFNDFHYKAVDHGTKKYIIDGSYTHPQSNNV